MTLNDIIVSALAQLDRGHDAQTLDIWREKFTRFVNEAVADLAGAYKPRETEGVALTDGCFFADALAKPCVKVLSVSQNGKALSFADGKSSGEIVVCGANPANAVDVNYLFMPPRVSSPTDVPDLPEFCHGLIVCYVVGRERASGEVGVQRGGNIYFQMYQAGKAGIRPHLGGENSYRIVNRW